MKPRRLSTVILSAICLLLASCSTINPFVKPTERPVTFRQKCPPLPYLPRDKDNRVTMGDLYNHDNEVVQMYGECAARHNSEPEVSDAGNAIRSKD